MIFAVFYTLTLSILVNQVFVIAAHDATRPLIVLRFDDGVTDGVEIAVKHGLVGTIFVVGWRLPDYTFRTQLRYATSHGWSVESHTMTHPDMTQLSASELEYELAESQRQLEGYGFSSTVFAYPFSRQNETVRDATSEYYAYATAERYHDQYLSVTKENPEALRYQIPAISILAQTTVEDVMMLVQRAIDEQLSITFILHRLGPEGSEIPGCGWTYERFDELCRQLRILIDENRIVVLTALDAYAQVFDN
jgi:hypothetical protein